MVPRMTKTMRVFVTGASGWIGTAVLKELRGAGYSVLGLAHSAASAAGNRVAWLRRGRYHDERDRGDD